MCSLPHVQAVTLWTTVSPTNRLLFGERGSCYEGCSCIEHDVYNVKLPQIWVCKNYWSKWGKRFVGSLACGLYCDGRGFWAFSGLFWHDIPQWCLNNLWFATEMKLTRHRLESLDVMLNSTSLHKLSVYFRLHVHSKLWPFQMLPGKDSNATLIFLAVDTQLDL